MNYHFSILFGLTFMTLAVACIAGIILVLVFLNMLKRRHPETWRDLGCPSFFNNTPRIGWNFMRFMKREQFRKLGDERLTSFGRFLKWYLVGYMFVFGLMTAEFVIAIHNTLVR